MKADDRYKKIFENMQEGYYESNPGGKFTFVNNAIYKIYGYTKDEVIGTGYEKYVDKDTAKLLFETFTKIYTTGQPLTIEYAAIRKDGTRIFVQNSGSLLIDETGETIGFHGLILNITERKEAEQTLKESEEKYRTILEGIEDCYYEVDIRGNFAFFNDSLCTLLGYSKDELVGMNNRQFMDQENTEKAFQTFNKVHTTGESAKGVTWEIIRKDGAKRYVEISASSIKNPEGRLVGFRGITRDITEREGAKIALEESKMRFEALFENANEMIITTDYQGYILRLNKKTEEISGYSRDELIGKSILKIAYPEDRDKYLQFWRDMLDGKNPRYELRGISKTGNVAHLLASGSVIKKGGEIVEIQYNAQDITENKQAQATIAHLKDRLKNIIESSPNLIISFDKKGSIDMVNPVAERFFNRPAASIKGKPISFIDPYLKRYESIIEKVQESKLPKFLSEEHLSDKSGGLFDVNIYPLTSNGTEGAVFNALDITERKRMELQLIHAQKMETIGELAGGFAHDFNNILTGVIGNLSMLRITNDESKKKQYMDTIENISNHAKNLVQQMLVLSTKEEGRPESLPVGTLIEEVLNIASSSIPKSIRIPFDDKDKDTNIFIDHAQFVQVLLNLIINAKDAIGDTQDGQIVIHTHPLHVDKNSKRQYLLPKASRYIRIDVTDNGCGIDKEILSRIFDPFFTTKGKGSEKGIGLGLSIAYNIVKNAGGSIQVSSERGDGTKFSIILPLSKETPALTQQDKAKTIKKGHGKILLVDDEDMIREIGKEIIEILGYKVTTVKDGHECIDILKRDSDKFDLVILDMIMPGLDGKHTLDEMKRLNINTRVIISSGFAFDYEADNILSDSLVVGRLNKPFNMNDLSHILSEILS